MTRENHPILLLGLFDTAIMTARCFRGTGIKVFGMDWDTRLNGFISNSIVSIQCPNPSTEEGKWLDFVLDWISTKSSFSFIIIPTSDKYVYLISKYRDRFKENALFLLPDHTKIENLINRGVQFQIAAESGIFVPAIYGNQTSTLEQVISKVELPVAIKPLNINEWKEKFSNKGFLIYDFDEFSKNFQLAKDKQVSFLVQKVIEGPNDCNFEVNTLLFPNGRYFQHSIQKIRQFPDRFGTATSIKSVENPEIEKQALQYLESQNFFGFSNIEFKYCCETSKYYYIETNPRVWLQVNFSKNIGLNFPLIYYDFLTKGVMPKESFTNLKKGVWVDFFPDILFWVRYRKKYKTSILKHVGSWHPLLSTGIFSTRDSRPFLREFFNLFKKK